MSLQLLVILVPVMFGLMGFALDLGRLYLIRGELNQAANAMALAAASQLIGATASTDTNVNNAAQQALNDTNGNRYNFGSLVIGSTGALSSTTNVSCFATAADASANNQTAGVDCSSAPPVFVQASISADAPLLFWSLLPGGETRRTTVASFAVAGQSAPLCTGCGIVPYAVLTRDATLSDQTDWGFVPNSLYTFYYSCTGTVPPAIAGIPVPYLMLNRIDPNIDETDLVYRQGAQGLISSTSPTPNACTTSATPAPLACVNVGDIEQIPTTGNATPGACSTVSAPTDVTYALCGVYSRIDSNPPGNCQTGVTDFAALSPTYLPDTDATYITDYSAYSGNGRRIITVAIVSTLATDTTCSAGMTVLGFRQFLVEPASDGTPFNPTDPNGRFVGLYLGSPAPVAQGWFDTRYAPSCRTYLTAGPGKVVLHQ
jgi:Flp pilus assembly protein TadG